MKLPVVIIAFVVAIVSGSVKSDSSEDVQGFNLNGVFGTSLATRSEAYPNSAISPNSATSEVPEYDTSSCGRKDVFSGYVLVQHSLEESEEIDDLTLRALESSFLETYNRLNTPGLYENVCDKECFRLIDTVQVIPMEETYIETTLFKKTVQRNFLYNITGRGIGTTPETPIFEHGDVDREEYDSHHLRDEAELHSSCSCHPNLEEERAPSEEEFKEEFHKRVRSQHHRGTLKNMQGVYKVIEYNSVACRGEETAFYTDIDLEFSEVPQESDYDVLQDSFMNSYNHLTVNYCDPNFRFITRVEIVAPVNSTTIRKKKKKKQRRGTVQFQVSAVCRGCNRKTKLFNNVKDDKAVTKKDDTTVTNIEGVEAVAKNKKRNKNIRGGDSAKKKNRNRIRAQAGPETSTKKPAKVKNDPAHRALYDLQHVSAAGTESCFCTAHPKAFRAPTQEEFAKHFTATVEHAPTSHSYEVKSLSETWAKWFKNKDSSHYNRNSSRYDKDRSYSWHRDRPH